MNKRIKELSEQAGITTNLDTDYYEKDMNKWVDYYSEKFAELIIQECYNVIIKSQHGHFNPGTSWDACKEHFGGGK